MYGSPVSSWCVHHLKNGQSRELPRTFGMRGREDLFLGKILYPLHQVLTNSFVIFMKNYLIKKLFSIASSFVQEIYCYKTVFVSHRRTIIHLENNKMTMSEKLVGKHFFSYGKGYFVENTWAESKWKSSISKTEVTNDITFQELFFCRRLDFYGFNVPHPAPHNFPFGYKWLPLKKSHSLLKIYFEIIFGCSYVDFSSHFCVEGEFTKKISPYLANPSLKIQSSLGRFFDLGVGLTHLFFPPPPP